MPKGVYIHKKNRTFSEEHRRRLSEAAKNRIFSEEHKRNLSLSHKGKVSVNKGVIGLFKHTEDAKRRIGESSKGNKYTLGKHLSEETRKKMSDARKGRKVTKETREKIRQSLTGRKRPELTGANNPMHTHPNAYKSRFGKTGYRKDLGVFVKSSWEANMMRIFKYLGLIVQYEPQSFVLSDGRTYRPDFLIHDTGELIEVKGRWLKDAYARFCMFKKEYPGLPIEVIGPKKYKNYINIYSHKIEMEV
jgi:hypothetical protein